MLQRASNPVLHDGFPMLSQALLPVTGLHSKGSPQRSLVRLATFSLHHAFACRVLMMMIAFITIKSGLVPLIEGLCAQILF